MTVFFQKIGSAYFVTILPDTYFFPVLPSAEGGRTVESHTTCIILSHAAKPRWTRFASTSALPLPTVSNYLTKH